MVDPIIFIFIAILGGSLGVKVTSTQNPVYSGLYLVLLFFLGSAISFLLGLEFMALLFLLVYAGAIAVLVLFVVMMLDVKAIENPWSSKKKRLLYISVFLFLCVLVIVGSNNELLGLLKIFGTACVSSLVSFSLLSYEQDIKKTFQPVVVSETVIENLKRFQERKKEGDLESSRKEFRKTFKELLEERVELWYNFSDFEGLTAFLRLLFQKESVEGSYGANTVWFIEFDSSFGISDLSYLLYSTHAILLIISGVILLIAMVGAISLTLQKSCPESLYRQLGRESRNAIFAVKEKQQTKPFISRNVEALH